MSKRPKKRRRGRAGRTSRYPADFLPELEALARDLGYPVCYEEGAFRGGRCRLGGRKMILLPRRSGTDERIEQLAAALSGLDLDAVYVRPALRALLERS